MNSQIRCGSCREKVLFIALRWMQPDRGMMWQAENSELAREFPADTASKARQSRLHQAQGVFPVFVFHSFVHFLNISCSKTWFFSPLMPINCLVKCPINSCSIRIQFMNNSCSKTNWWLFNESNSWTLMFQKACAPNHKSKRRTYCPLQRKSPCCWKPLLEKHQCSWIGSLKKTKFLFEHELNVFGTRIK